ncbi:leucyl/phenylalanyl-tRNA--protein transferase [Ketogulonicigenium robustum]|uniref:Leucyl/phenylalanyl-tRNA--protein transferase n=1 Tax=Ketogulonicigenium robustum TaxID=92947 RepID=A0A1W6P038_9RHOB|nr:leucyl/phenylalanyl-tRNA--protein transferase [Ketogulonicigenium robustum]ARO14809.1 leucyl/phenylalanyl-tRNA--protein transferase [Ketogulonicigenium robustum]
MAALTPDDVLAAYRFGIFPMAESRDDPHLFWVDPEMRGLLPIDGLHISRSLARRIRRQDFRITYDTAFHPVMAGCADRPETWINPPIFTLYSALYDMGHAHSVEVWSGDDLVGGSYGLKIGGAFFGESMFSRQTDASKVALAYLTTSLRSAGYSLFDTQFLTPHLASLGGHEVPRKSYREMLSKAVARKTEAKLRVPQVHEVLQLSGQTS